MKKELPDEWKRYLDHIKPMFDVIAHKRVLEIGTGDGTFWPMMREHNPASITGLDPDTRWKIDNWDPEARENTIRKDMFDYLPRGGYDVIVAFGIIYKFHSPIHFLELVARSGPQYFLLEQIVAHREHVNAHKQETNGARGTWLTESPITWVVHLPVEITTDVMQELGYELKRKSTLESTIPGKKHTCQMLFEKVN